MIRKKFLTALELQAEVDSWSDEDECSGQADKINIIITPPEMVDDLSDTEELDDNMQIIADDEKFPQEVAGSFEVEYLYNEENNKLANVADDDMNLEPSTSKAVQETRSVNNPQEPKWSHRKNYDFCREPFDNTATTHKELYEKIGSLSPIQLWECFIDDEVLEFVVDSTNKYAGQNNDPEFCTTIDEIKCFLGILYITGYHTLPNIQAYWSNRESLGCEYIKKSMSRDRFKQIKKYIHVCDNQNLLPSDKFAKVSPLNDILNKKFMQFAVFSQNLSIDEQMIAYYGRHSCKMFIKGKPIRFGYKYWCLTSDDGYCYQFMPYAGAATKFSNDYGLGENVVLELLTHLKHRENHNVTFDNFFTSYKLMSRLSLNGYFATGTVRDNRANHAPLVSINDMKKRPRGSSDYAFDRNNKVLVARWNDNSVVTIMSNFLKHEPVHHVKRYDRKNKKMITVEQPLLIHEYNHRMGGVDLFDNAMNNYRIKMRGKKWYWPLLTNAFDAAMVNAWKLKIFCSKYEKSKPISQFDFRVEVSEALVTDVRGCKRRVTYRDGNHRTDGLNHIVETLDRRGRCRQCGIKTQFGCKKCNALLHPKNCFSDYHNAVEPDAKKIKRCH